MLETLKTYCIKDRDLLSKALTHNPIEAAYLLADLESPYFENTQWLVAGPSQKDIFSVILVYTKLNTPALLTFGKASGISKIFETNVKDLPKRYYGMIWPEHEEYAKRIYIPSSERRMIRMGIEKGSFTPITLKTDVSPLKKEDLTELIELMVHYPGNYFEAAMFRKGFYYGIRLNGCLVSAGGIHTYSPTYGIAALGNIVTHKDFRRQGLALECTSELMKMLFKKVNHIVLNVEEGNKPAIQCYQRLGFSFHRIYTEGLYLKKERR